MAKKKPSAAYWLLPVLFTWLGGIIGYYLLKKRDKEMANNMLYLGVALTFAYIVINFVVMALL